MNDDRGAVSFSVLLALLLVSGLCAAAMIAVLQARALSALDADDFPEPECFATAKDAIGLLAENASSGADSPFDPVFGLVQRVEGFDIRDVSSQINPNWVSCQLLSESKLSFLLCGADSADMLRQNRFDDGFSIAVKERYTGIFTEEAIGKFLSPYSYLNLNNADEFCVERLATDCTGNSADGSMLRDAVRSARSDGRLIDRTALRGMLWQSDERLGACVGIEPQMNVNFVDPAILRGLLSYNAFHIGNPEAVASALLEARARKELTLENVREICGLDTNNRLFTYLGDTTWFWRISMRRGDRLFIAIVSRRLPKKDDAVSASGAKTHVDSDDFQIVSWSYGKKNDDN